MASKKDEESRNTPATPPTNTAPDSTASVPATAATAHEMADTAGQVTDKAVDAFSRALDAAPVAAAATGGVSTDHVTELNNIDFKKMIGGPLQAAVDAQVASSLATVDFIQKVGFTQPPLDANGKPELNFKRELVMADFSYKRTEKDKDGNDVVKDVEIKVPLLVMLQIPSLRIDHVIIDFNVKLNSVETATVSDKLGIDASVQGGWGPVSFKVSASYQRQTTSGVEVKKEYALNVNVKAVQDEIPVGLEKVLGLLAT